jgi:hypothetical protein
MAFRFPTLLHSDIITKKILKISTHAISPTRLSDYVLPMALSRPTRCRSLPVVQRNDCRQFSRSSEKSDLLEWFPPPPLPQFSN